MKNLFKVFALLLGLGLGLAQGASAAVLHLDDFNRFETQVGGAAANYDFGILDAYNTYDWTSRLNVAGVFTQTVDFKIGAGELAGSLYNTQVKTTKVDIDNLTYSLWQGASQIALTKEFSSPLTDAQYSVFGVTGLTGGNYQLKISGNTVGTGKVIDNVTLFGQYNLSVSPVPEPEEWAMMMLGLGLMGMKLSRKDRNQDSFAIQNVA